MKVQCHIGRLPNTDTWTEKTIQVYTAKRSLNDSVCFMRDERLMERKRKGL